MPGLEGTTLGPYRLLHRLGRGGMSEVYLAYDERRDHQVAIKVMSGSHFDYVQRFHREAEAILNLKHPHILPAFEYGEDAPWYYLVLLYAEHGPLSRRLTKLATTTHTNRGDAGGRVKGFQRGHLTLEEADLLLEQIASALQYAHDSGIIHRDIKPSNILLRDNQYAYLADFGLAKALEGANTLTQTGSLLGTPEYMAPELTEGPAGISSDIYALGILLYEMLTGRVPFSGETPIATYWKHLREQPVPPSRYNSAIPRPVDLVVLRALEKNPRRRYQSAYALAMAYKRALYSSMPVGVGETPAFEFDLAEVASALPIHELPPLTPVYHDQMAQAIDATGAADPVYIGNPLLSSSVPREDVTVDEPYVLPTPHQSFHQTPHRPWSQDTSSPLQQPAELASTHTVQTPRVRTHPSRASVKRRRNWYSNSVLVAACVGVGFLLIISILMSFVYVNYVSQQEVMATATAQTLATVTANTANANATTQARATATVNVLNSAVAGAPILSDSLFGNSSSRWPENATCQFIAGSYHVLVQQTGFLQTCVSPTVTVTNVAMQANVALISGNNAGLLLRVSNEHFYEYGITDQGQFFFRRHDSANADYTYLINNTTSDAIITSGVNTLTVIASGSDFKLYANGAFVGKSNDTSYAGGQIGFATGTLASTSSGEGSFANLKVFAL